MVERLSINFPMMRTYDDPNGPFVRHSDYADLERQIAELRASLKTATDDKIAFLNQIEAAEKRLAEVAAELVAANADRCFHTDDDPNCKLESTFMRLVDAAEAENARLKALPLKDERHLTLDEQQTFDDALRKSGTVRQILPLKDEVERVLDDARVWISENVRPSDAVGNEILCEIRVLLSRLRAGVQEGWKLVPVEPSRGRLISMAIRDNHAFLINPDPNVKWTSGVKPEHRESVLRSMRQLYEEAIGEGFYSSEKEQSYIDSLERSMRPAAPSEHGGERE